MNLAIDVQDPRGYTVTCKRTYWESHILGNHPDLEGKESIAQNAIRSPRHGFIYTSKWHPDRRIYYGEHRNRIEIKVVVEFNADHHGSVVSVSFVSNRPNGEYIIWPE